MRLAGSSRVRRPSSCRKRSSRPPLGLFLSLFCGMFLFLCLFPIVTQARAILGVDLGSLYMKVALVQSGSPLEIVTNLHSKRKTEQMILFDREQRFYGADAMALLARKSHVTPAAMSVLLGRDDQHPVVQVLAERHYPIRPSYNESRSGVVLTVDGIDFTPEELVAMVLSHAVDIAVAHATAHGSSNFAPPKDCVLTVPSYATQPERRALLDAAQLVNLNVLELLEENTAAALHYAMDKQFPDEQLFLFYNMGASALQVSLIRFFNYEQPQKFGKPKTVPALEVLSKAWDATLGGQAFDHLLVEFLADQFNQAWQKTGRAQDKDVRNYPRAMTKLRLQANKVKHVLSANTEIPVYMDAVHDDVSLSTHITRAQLEELAHDLLKRAVQPIDRVLENANKTLDDLTGIELIGGGMRIPRIQTELSKHVGDKLELGMHINADESMALGAAFAGANVSTAFRVRQVGMTDVNPFAMSVHLSDLMIKDNKDDDEEEQWNKQATIFKAFGKMGVKKTIAFTHDRDVHCALDYVDGGNLPPGTELSIERYNITGVSDFAEEMAKKDLGKPKVSLQFELSSSGITSLVKAEAAVEETYTVEEEVEVDDDEEADENASSTEATKDEAKQEEASNETTDNETAAATAAEANETESNATESAAEKKKPKKKIKVEKEKKRVHKKPLSVTAYHVGRVRPHSQEQLLASKNKLLDMAAKDKERMMLEESRNKVESYIYRIKNKLEDDAEVINKVSTDEQRKEVRKLAEDAEEWMYEDGYSADYPTMEDKFAELSGPFEKIMLRVEEMTARPEAVEALRKKLTEVEQLMVKWETSMPQVTEEERGQVLEKVEEARKWIADNEQAQSKKKPHDEPAFLSTDVPAQLKPIQTIVVRLSRKPKPKPAKNATKAENATDDASSSNATASGENATKDADDTAANATEAEATTEESKTEEESATGSDTTKEEGDEL